MTDQYPALYASYRWLVPSQFNIADICLQRWAENPHEGRRPALHVEDELGTHTPWSYQQLNDLSLKLANGLTKMGVQPGDRVVLAMGPTPEYLAALMAVFTVQAVAVPLSKQFSQARALHCIRDSQAQVAIVDALAGPDLLPLLPQCPQLVQIIGQGFAHDDIIPWRTLLARQSASSPIRPTAAYAPALLSYSPTEHDPGRVFAHAALIGALPGFVCTQNWFPQPGDLLFSLADWSSTDGLLNGLLPALYFGRPCLAPLGPISAKRLYELLEHYRVTNVLIPASLLHALQQASEPPQPSSPPNLRAIAALTPPGLDPTLVNWCQQTLQVTPNSVLSLPQAHAVVGQSHAKWPAQAATFGRPIPGHLADILDPQGLPCAVGVTGELALNRHDLHNYPDPSLSLGTWQAAGSQIFPPSGNWVRTGLTAYRDTTGDFWPTDTPGPG